MRNVSQTTSEAEHIARMVCRSPVESLSMRERRASLLNGSGRILMMSLGASFSD